MSLTEVLEILEGAFQNGNAFVHLDQDGRVCSPDEDGDIKNCIYIADLSYSAEGRYCYLLLNRGDPDVVHPSFINPIARTVTVVPPGEDEVQGWSAHLVIDMNERHGKHRACFEKMQNVSTTLVQRYFDALLKKAADDNPEYQFEKMVIQRGQDVEVVRSYRPALTINRVPSSSLKKDIERGFLSAINLIREVEEYNGPGDPSTFRSIEQKLTIRPAHMSGDRAKDFIRQVSDWGREQNFSAVQFEIKGLEGGTSAHPKFELEQADAMETLYSRTKLIDDFNDLLQSCYSSMNMEIVERIVREIGNEGNW
ncbi:hypothetical protein [Novosphingobium sp. SG707]|uniref:hypothetical protein n=1 Tax=Novosphingobium sp. SG707 TaxID=2586996 RepID=UPI001445BC16|nr:hypothetical protein [Novosphingobium sp. SG707]NKJ02789.1 hypothetical protein [Novosphingobium sp. SG707]